MFLLHDWRAALAIVQTAGITTFAATQHETPERPYTTSFQRLFSNNHHRNTGQQSGRRDTGDTAMFNVIESIRRWHRRSNTAAQLHQLDDRMLADIGIVRGNIAEAARRKS
jgi:uncharacterized protein YjiS (DUF1127 family)